MGKSADDEPGFSFAKLTGADNYKKWVREIQHSLESVGLRNHIFSDTENLKLVAIVLLSEDLKNDTKLERQENCADKIIA